MLQYLQQHTIDLYNLTHKKFELKQVPAHSLLTVNRFDLFAKLFYIKYKEINPDLALKIYVEHIKAFNPDFKEPGRTDKSTLSQFVQTFDHLISHFELHEFDKNISLIPVSEDGIILDASHRLSALIFYNKEVSIVKFEQVQPVTQFDHSYFRKRGLPNNTSDQIVLSALEYLPYARIVFFISCDKKVMQKNTDLIAAQFPIMYTRTRRLSPSGLKRLLAVLAINENRYASYLKLNKFRSVSISLVYLETESKDELITFSKNFNSKFWCNNNLCGISVNNKQVREVSEMLLSERIKTVTSKYTRILDDLEEGSYRLKNIYLLGFKTKLAKYLQIITTFKK